MKRDERLRIGGEVIRSLLLASDSKGIPQSILRKNLNISKSDLSKIVLPLEEVKELIIKETQVPLRTRIEGYGDGYRGHIVFLPEASIDMYKKILTEYPNLIVPLLESHYFQTTFTRDVIKKYLKSLEKDRKDFKSESFIESFKYEESEGIYQLEHFLKQSHSALNNFLFPDFSTNREFKNQIEVSIFYDLVFSSGSMKVSKLFLTYKGAFTSNLDGENFDFNGGLEF